MFKTFHAISFLLVAAFISTAALPARTFYGNTQRLGAGNIRTFVTLDENQVPTEVGIEADHSLFDINKLPSDESDGLNDVLDQNGVIQWYCCGHEVNLNFPSPTKNYIPFDHFVMNWNPLGHPPGPHPVGIYRAPHFDFHFYTLTEEERKSITAPTAEEACIGQEGLIPVTCADLITLTTQLPADQDPPNHVSVGAVEPHMGNHLLDFTEPEFPPTLAPFTHTWIFGAQGGKLTFWEPMITLEYIQAVADGSLTQATEINQGTVVSVADGTTVTVDIN